MKHFSKYYTIPGGKTVWEGIVLTTGSKGLGWYIASTGLIVLWGKEARHSYFYCNYPSGVDPPKCVKCPHFWQQSPGSSYADILVKLQRGNKTTLLYSRLRFSYKKIFLKSIVKRKNEWICHTESWSQMKTHGQSCRMVSGSQNNKFSIQLSASQIFNSTQISKQGECSYFGINEHYTYDELKYLHHYNLIFTSQTIATIVNVYCTV